MTQLKEGQWVAYTPDSDSADVIIAYINTISNNGDRVWIDIPSTEHVGVVESRKVWSWEIVPCPVGDLQYGDIDAMIDIALDTGDEVWFKELCEQKKALDRKKNKLKKTLSILLSSGDPGYREG
ncbi:hypothetical protein D1872_51200 [compost metagenome]